MESETAFRISRMTVWQKVQPRIAVSLAPMLSLGAIYKIGNFWSWVSADSTRAYIAPFGLFSNN
jgi:hypothetical protein